MVVRPLTFRVLDIVTAPANDADLSSHSAKAILLLFPFVERARELLPII